MTGTVNSVPLLTVEKRRFCAKLHIFAPIFSQIFNGDTLGPHMVAFCQSVLLKTDDDDDNLFTVSRFQSFRG